MAKAVVELIQRKQRLVRLRMTTMEDVPLFACGTCMYLQDLVGIRREVDFQRISLALKQETPALLESRLVLVKQCGQIISRWVRLDSSILRSASTLTT